MPPSDLGAFLRHSNVVDNDAQLCVIYNNYVQTPQFLETVCPTLSEKHTLMMMVTCDLMMQPLCIFATGVSSTGGAAANSALRLAHGTQQHQEVRGQRMV